MSTDAHWLEDDTERWLTDFPLPADFTWNGVLVQPKYQLKKGYGFWLRTAGSYNRAFRGLFALTHAVLAQIPVGRPMPTPDELAAELRAYASVPGTLGLDEPDPAVRGDTLTTPISDVLGEDEAAALERLQEEQHERAYEARGVDRAQREHAAGAPDPAEQDGPY